jgi:hypothetical protein
LGVSTTFTIAQHLVYLRLEDGSYGVAVLDFSDTYSLFFVRGHRYLFSIVSSILMIVAYSSWSMKQKNNIFDVNGHVPLL